MPSKDLLRARQSKKVGYPTLLVLPSRPCCHSITTCSASGYGSFLNTTVCNTLKIAVFAPMPSASVSSTTAVNPGCFTALRIA